MQVWNVLHVARWNAGPTKLPKIRHLGTIKQLSQDISSQLRHVSTIGKKLVKQQYLLHRSPQYGELQPTSGWDRSSSLGTPANFDRFRILAALLHGTWVVGVGQSLRHLTEGAMYRTQKVAKNLPSGLHSTTLSGCIFTMKVCIVNRKKTC